MQEELNKLKEILGEIADINSASAVLSWDQQTYMPKKGGARRGLQLATLSKISHQKFTSPEVGGLLEDLKAHLDDLDPDSDEARLIRVTSRDYEKSVKVSTEWVVEFSQLSSDAFPVWVEAREKNDFPKFEPYLDKLINLRRDYANFFAPFDHIYDPLLDDFEPGMKTEDVKEIFTYLREKQVELIKKIASKPQVNDAFLHQPFDEKKQWDFGVDVITDFGYEWDRGRQDKTPHPFTTTFGHDDVRITTRVYPDFLNPALFGTMHEAGHALYELGVDPALSRTPLQDGASLAVHESQSRMWENLVGRSLPFWEFYYPRLKEYFPTEFEGIDLNAFYKGINKVEPSMIRVEADEATYNLHIMLRLELEIAMMEGTLSAGDLPDAWNSRMEKYLGVTPPNDSEGVLQDIHWAYGAIGYFSTYALGNLVSVQLWEKINDDIPNMDSKIRNGEFSDLLAWLREKVHRYGRKFEPQELVQKITGSKIDPKPYLSYLETKFGEIYGI